MIRPPLPSECLSQFDTDKHGSPPDRHNYATKFYDHYLPHYRWCGAVLEIGIDRGESLRAWRSYFRDAVVYGVDCRRGTLVHEDRIHSIHLDASDERELTLLANEFAGYFSVLIDDGSHQIADQLLFVRVMRKALKVGGILVVEDVSSEENGRLLAAEGLRVESWDTHLRHDNRLAFLLKEEDS